MQYEVFLTITSHRLLQTVTSPLVRLLLDASSIAYSIVRVDDEFRFDHRNCTVLITIFSSVSMFVHEYVDVHPFTPLFSERFYQF